MLEHGGRLRAAAERYRIPLADWVDLSTGINPRAYPVPALPPEVWQRLPESNDGLEAAAAAYYGSAGLLPVAGSQAAIQALPACFAPGRVITLAPTYAEHPHAWREHQVRALPAAAIGEAVDSTDTLLLVQPNNPDAQRFPREQLLAWRERLAARGGRLIVDEAFLDAEPGDSLVPLAAEPGLVVLRSVGKFFGLAGARVGFVFAEPALLARLADRLGPWAVSGPARAVTAVALADRPWQAEARQRLNAASARLAALLDRHGLAGGGGTALFQWRPLPDAAAVHARLAEQAILTRLFETPAGLRFGLPGPENEWARLEAGLSRLCDPCRCPHFPLCCASFSSPRWRQCLSPARPSAHPSISWTTRARPCAWPSRRGASSASRRTSPSCCTRPAPASGWWARCSTATTPRPPKNCPGWAATAPSTWSR